MWRYVIWATERYVTSDYFGDSDRIEEAMERLTNRQRTALHLRAAEGMDYAAISTVLGCSSPAARMHVLEARRKILDRVKEHLDP